MIIKSKGKEYELTFKARQMIKLGEEVGGQYELELGAYKGDIKILAKVLSILTDAFSYDEALDVIDELIENGEKIKDVYSGIFEEMNKKAFFTKKLEVADFPPINYEEYLNKMISSVGDEMVEGMSKETFQNMSKNLRK